MPKISIFVPVFNGSAYLDQTLNSVLQQSFNDFELLCVDDSSSDSSLHILKKYSKSDNRIKVFSKPNEGSVPFSWQFIFPHINSKYTCYLSQDDFWSPDYLSKLYQRAKETGADAVVPEVEYYFEGKHHNKIQSGLNGDLNAEINGRDAFSYSLDWQISGFALWKTELIKRVGIQTDSFNSDELAQRLWFLNSNKVVFSNARFYYRQDNPNAITKLFNYHQYSTIKTNLHLLKEMKEMKMERQIIEKYHRQYFLSLFYLKSKAVQNKMNYSANQNQELEILFKMAFRELMAVRVKNCNIFEKIKFKLLSFNLLFFNLASWLFALKIRFNS